MGSSLFTHKSKNNPLMSNQGMNNKVVDDLEFKSLQSASVPSTVPSFRSSGSKDEAFFDSQAWLESDCDEDFQSVNGDMTPSRGSTSSNQSTTNKILPVNKIHFTDGSGTLDFKPQPSPTGKKKRLSELFEDSFHDEEFSPHVTSGENEYKSKKPSTKSTPCCLPSLLTSLSFRERKNKVH